MAQCLTEHGIATQMSATDKWPYPVDDHSLACLAYGNWEGGNVEIDKTRGIVHCAPVGGPFSTCAFDLPSLAGAFTHESGALNRVPVNLGSVNVTCDADIKVVVSVDPSSYPIKMGGGRVTWRQ